MPEIVVGETTIPYRVRRSRRARRLRIVVSPGMIEVVAPMRLRESRIQAFVGAKRRWLYDKTRALRERPLEPLPPRFVDGARILFRGRFLKLHVEPAPVRRASLRYASAFHVRVPRAGGEADRERQTRTLVVAWLRRRALEQAQAVARRLEPALGRRPAVLRTGNQKTVWGSCSSRGLVSLNWRLMAAPAAVYEYVVIHELCHLREPNHGRRFWALVESLLPDYRERRAWLKEHGVGLR